MYNQRNILYIISSISSIDKIADYTGKFNDADTLLKANNQLNFNGTITLLIAIAEETKKIDTQLKEKHPNIQWQNIADMRNFLAHDYRGIDPEIVFDVIKNELPNLQTALIQMLKEFPHSSILEILETKLYHHLKKIIE